MAKTPVSSPRPGHRRWQVPCRLLAAFLVATLVLTGSAAAGQSSQATADAKSGGGAGQPNREYLIKAAILYNFAKFTRWPATSFASADAPLRLCVLGADPFGDALATIDGKRVGERSLRTRVIAETSQIDGCHLLFVSASETDRLGQVLAATDGAAILTVADMPNFCQAGGIIALNIVEDRTRFEVNRAAADRAGLALSAKLLRLAETVIRD